MIFFDWAMIALAVYLVAKWIQELTNEAAYRARKEREYWQE